MKFKYFFIVFLWGILGPGIYVKGQIYITEFLSSNTHTNINPENGIYSDWIELYNSSSNSIDLGGYFLSDNQSDPQKWSFPLNTIIQSHEYLLVWADKTDKDLHTNFGLSRDGEEICLYSPDLFPEDIISYNAQVPDVSQGRDPADQSNWLYYGKPTPGRANSVNGIIEKVFPADVEFSLEGGFYNTTQIVSLSCYEPDAIIRYTTNGSIPVAGSNQFINDITVTSTTVIRAACFVTGKLPGKVSSRTYFINEKSDLPVFSISTDPYNLWDEEFGIYIDGSSFTGPRLTRNCCKKGWERPIHIEFFECDGNLAFESDAGLEVKGRQNCEFPRKPLGVYFKGKYGQNEIKHKIFAEKEIDIFRSFVLRPGGADGIGNLYNGTMFRDGLLGNILIGEMDIDYEAFRPAILFINGKYWGIHNIRERIKSDYLETNHNVDPNNIDILENPANGGIIQGDDVHYQSLLKFITSNNLSVRKNYEYIKTLIDINEFINYQIAEIYVNNADWAINNVECWRPRTEDGKWRWIFYDVEGGFGLYSSEDYKADRFDFSEDSFLRHKFLFSRLLNNPDFKNEFVQRFASYLNTTFKPERVIQILETMKSDIEAEMPVDIERWGGLTTLGGGQASCLESMADWETNVEIMREFARQRPYYVKEHIKKNFGLSDEIEVIVNTEHGRIKINNIFISDTSYYFQGLPIRLEAVPDIGYQFAEWEGISDTTEILLDTENDLNITAIFQPTGENILPSVITGETILSAEGSPYLAPGDIEIPENSSLIVEAGVEILMPDRASIYDYGKLIVIGSEESPVIIKGNPGTKMERWGAICVINATSPAELSYLIIDKASKGGIDRIKYHANISVYNSDIIINNVNIINSEDLPFYSEFGDIEISNSTFYSSGVCDYINITNTNNAIVENCIFQGNNAYNVDAIDYDFVVGGIIRNNYISGFSGFNSDGIDIGNCNNILVQNNIIRGIIDKGISIGGGSTAVISENIIINCSQGIGIKDEGSYAYVDHNTFYNNSYSIACFQKTVGRGGGKADVNNSILSRSFLGTYLLDEYSELNFSYSLSDTELIPGVNNIFADPSFNDPVYEDFSLKENSPCIDNGDPYSKPDPDGSRTDIGGEFFDNRKIRGIFINEILICENQCSDQNGSWIEIYNSNDSEINISGLYLSKNSDKPTYVQISDYEPLKTQIPAKSHLRIWVNNNNPDEVLFFDLDPEITGGSFFISQAVGDIIYILDTLSYYNSDTGKSYGRYPDGSNFLTGFSIPTPGLSNIADSKPVIQNLFINEILASNNNNEVDNYGDYDDWFEIFNAGAESVDIGGLYLTDDLDNLTQYRIPENKPDSTTLFPGGFIVLWADKDLYQGILHVDFRLANKGEVIGLVQVNGTDTILIDSLKFGAQTQDISYGRYPDASNNIINMEQTTPGAYNSISGVGDDKLDFLFEIYPNPASENLNIIFSNPVNNKTDFKIYNNFGVAVYTESLPKIKGFNKIINLQSFPSGVYYLNIRSGNISETRKFIVNK